VTDEGRDSEIATVMHLAVVRGREQKLPNEGGAKRATFGDAAAESLHAARSRFIARLHARSDDYDATYGLREIDSALCA
jgi:hypothetical protein